jgi:hypothetical protein
MIAHARRRGLRGFVADVLLGNARMLRLARNSSLQVHAEKNQDAVHITILF